MTDARSMTVAPSSARTSAISRGHPGGGQAEDRVDRGPARQAGPLVLAEHHRVPGRGLAAGDLDAVHLDGVGLRRQRDLVAGADRRDDQAEVAGDPAAQRLHPVHQPAAAAGVEQVEQVGREFELERLDPQVRSSGRRSPAPARDGLGAAASAAFSSSHRRACAGAPRTARTPARTRKGSFGRPGSSPRIATPTAAMRSARWEPASWLARSPPRPPSSSLADAGDDDAGGDRDQQRRHLRDQTVTDGQQRVLGDRVVRPAGGASRCR